MRSALECGMLGRMRKLKLLIALALAACASDPRAPAAPGDDDDGGAPQVQVISQKLSGPYSIQGIRYTSADVTTAPDARYGIPEGINANFVPVRTSSDIVPGTWAFDVVSHCWAGLFQNPDGTHDYFTQTFRGWVNNQLISTWDSASYEIKVTEIPAAGIDGAIRHAFLTRTRFGRPAVQTGYATYLAATTGIGKPDLEVKFTPGNVYDAKPQAWCHAQTDSGTGNSFGWISGAIP